MINFRNAEECRFLTYEQTEGMSVEDAIATLKEHVDRYHAAETEKERMWLPRARLIRVYEIAIKAMERSIT